MRRTTQYVILASILSLLFACNLPYAARPTTPGPSPEASSTLFTGATLPGAPTATQPAINIITTTPGVQSSAPPATAAPPTATSKPVLVYPDTPEGVIQAFVEAYPDDTDGMRQYLSASLRASLPAGGPGELLNVQGDINGFLILSGSSVPDPPQAVFQCAIQVGTEQVVRTFNLIQENGRWVISGIQ